MRLSRLAIRRPVTTLVLLASLVVLGTVALSRMKLAYFPDIEFPGIFIEVPYPNSSPTQIERTIIRPIEEILSTISGIKEMNSEATADAARIFLQFDWGTKLDMVRVEVAEKIEMIRKDLPADVDHIYILNFNATDLPVVQARISAPGIDLASNYDLLEKRVKIPIQRIPGVARVELNGVLPKAIYIDLILDKLIEHGVNVGELVQSLSQNNVNVSLGVIRDDHIVMRARALGVFPNFSALMDFPVNAHGLRLGDIAEVRYEEPPLDFGRHLNHQNAVALEVYKEPTANVVEVATRVTRLITEHLAKDPYLQGIQLFVWQDQAREIRDGLKGIATSGLWGGLLAVFLLYLFLRRIDMTLIVSLAIPFSLLCGVMVLYYLGYTLNAMSMMGLMLAVGMLVDNAIVVLESIDATLRQGYPRPEAADRGARLVELAVIASTTTTIIVFLPLIFGRKTQITTFLAEIGIAISLTLLASLLISLTLIPLTTSRLLPERLAEPVGWIRRIQHVYVRCLGWTLRHRGWMTGIVVLTLASLAFPKMLGLQTSPFAGTQNRRQLLRYDFVDFTYTADVEAIVTRVEQFLERQRDRWPMESIYSYFGDSQATTVVTFAKEDVTDAEARAFRQYIRARLPKFGGVRVYFEDDQETGGTAKYFSVYLYGDDLERLKRLAARAMAEVRRIPGIEDLRLEAETGRREVQIVPNPERTIRARLTPGDVSQIALFALGGQRLPHYMTPEKEVEMIVGLRKADRENLEDFQNLPVFVSARNGTGPGNSDSTAAQATVPLRSLVRFRSTPGQNLVRRLNRKNYVAIRATYEGQDFPGIRRTITSIMNGLDLPAGYSWSFDRRVLESDIENRQMIINFLMALVLLYLVMAALFENVIHPLAILVSIPFALVGVLWFLLITGTPFNIMAQIGLLILMGIVVNNGIVFIDRVHQLRAQGLPREEALLQAGEARLRPILMTAGTTVFGMLPLAVGWSGVFGVYYFPLARAVIGGLTTSTLLTLLILPYVYTLWDDLSVWLGRLWYFSQRGVIRPKRPAREG